MDILFLIYRATTVIVLSDDVAPNTCAGSSSSPQSIEVH